MKLPSNLPSSVEKLTFRCHVRPNPAKVRDNVFVWSAPSPRTPPDLPNFNLNCEKNSFCEKQMFQFFRCFFSLFWFPDDATRQASSFTGLGSMSNSRSRRNSDDFNPSSSQDRNRVRRNSDDCTKSDTRPLPDFGRTRSGKKKQKDAQPSFSHKLFFHNSG